jgi:hypothetical protein
MHLCQFSAECKLLDMKYSIDEACESEAGKVVTCLGKAKAGIGKIVLNLVWKVL